MGKANREARRAKERQQRTEEDRKRVAEDQAVVDANLSEVAGYTIHTLPTGNAGDTRAAHTLLADRGAYHGDEFWSGPTFERQLQTHLREIRHSRPELGRIINLVARRDATGQVVGALHARIPYEPLEASRAKPGVPYPGRLERSLNIVALAVDVAHEGNGLGSRLVREVEARARAAGFTYLIGYGEGDEAKLRHLYGRLGFTCAPNSAFHPRELVGDAYGMFRAKRPGFHFWKTL